MKQGSTHPRHAILGLIMTFGCAGAGVQAATTDNGLPLTNPTSVVTPSAHVIPPGTTHSLTTTYASGNSFAGNTFDLTANRRVTVLGFDVNLDNPGSTNTVAVYYRLGTANGFENNAGAWTLLGRDTNVGSEGDGNPTSISVGQLNLIPGQTYGFYVDLESYGGGTALLYTNGATPYTDGTLTLVPYVGKGDPAFSGSTFTPRTWNGTVHYTSTTSDIPTLSVWGVLGLGFSILAAGVLVTRRRPQEA